ncbi:ATP-binding protein [Bacteroides sp. UBA939]|uniref:ATP-binding protein n=1 Tax=Bacteroides sp. UBA939 TaxID=1946092 RepID=UPI0025C13118|nr:ATP-binding protein [Bacteroides sp. UBA939]
MREALVNALCHRQYEKYNLTIGIAIYDDRIEIENPGMLPPQLTPETIKQPHISYPYNPIIADVLFKTTFLENWGSGVGRIVDACKRQNVEEPVWRTQGGFVIVTFKRPTKDSNTIQVPSKYDPSTTQVAILINAMNDNFMSITEIMKACNLSSRKKSRENYVTPALEDGAIERKYPNQPNHPKQQYRLTEKAKVWKQTNDE